MKNRARTWAYVHRFALAMLAVILVAGMAALAGAQQAGSSQTPTPAPMATSDTKPANDYDINRRELHNFDVFLDNHPKIAKDLKSNPGLANDPNYLSQHPQLQQFLSKHPGVKEELHENPNRFVNRERGFERSGKDVTRGELRNFDGFLDKHPEVEEDLRKNPSLADNPEYLAKHPEFKEFLENHPGVRGELKEHPRYFEKRERRFERHEGDEHRRRQR